MDERGFLGHLVAAAPCPPALGKQHLPATSSAVPGLLLWQSLELISLWHTDFKAPQGGRRAEFVQQMESKGAPV